MYPVVGLSLLLLSSCGHSLADTCGVTDFLEQLIQSVHRIQSSGSPCGPASETRIGKAGPVGAPGPRGPPGQIDMEAIKQFVEDLIDKHLMNRIGFGDHALGQWLQVDFGSVKKIAGVITQGRSLAHSQWVRSYKVACGNDSGQSWTTVQENGRDKVFQANDDMETKVYNRLP